MLHFNAGIAQWLVRLTSNQRMRFRLPLPAQTRHWFTWLVFIHVLMMKKTNASFDLVGRWHLTSNQVSESATWVRIPQLAHILCKMKLNWMKCLITNQEKGFDSHILLVSVYQLVDPSLTPIRVISSVVQSVWFTPKGSGVRLPHHPPY